MKNNASFDVIVIGGSYAGVSASTILGRSLRKVLIIDSGKPVNSPARESHSFLTRDGSSPADILTIARSQLSRYDTVTHIYGRAVTVLSRDDGISVLCDDGQAYQATKLLVATGVRAILPQIPGFEACWGKSIFHCPYCHAYEQRGQILGVIGNEESGYALTRLVSNWSDKVTLFTNGDSELQQQHRDNLHCNGISLNEAEITNVTHKSGHIEHVLLEDGKKVFVNALFAKMRFIQHSGIAQSLGVEEDEDGLLICDEDGKTAVDHVFVAGDNCSSVRQVAVANAGGVITGITINRELTTERFLRADQVDEESKKPSISN